MFRSVLRSISSHDRSHPLPPIWIEAGQHGTGEGLSRKQLYGLACAAGQHFRSLGVVPGERVVTFLPTGRPLLQCIFGAWAAGAMICVLTPTVDAGRSSPSLDRVAEMLRVAQPRVIITSGDDLAALGTIAAEIGAVMIRANELPTDEIKSAPPPHENQPDEPAVIQFTSGSTGLPKAVVIEHGQLVENARTIADWTGFRKDDCFASWLPIYHDFGFVVGLCMPILYGARLVLIPTETFGRNPLNWLRIMSDQKATFSGAPSSGAAILCKSMFAAKAANFDLTLLRCLWLGAEPVAFGLCEEFERLYQKAGTQDGCHFGSLWNG